MYKKLLKRIFKKTTNLIQPELNFFLERVLFPTDILTFMAPNDSRVEIWGNELYGPKLEERIRISADNEDTTLVA